MPSIFNRPVLSFHFVLTPIELGLDQKIEVASNAVLRRANLNEVEVIKQKIAALAGPSSSRVTRMYECEERDQVLPAKDWKYCVIAGASDETIIPIELSGVLLETSVELGFCIRDVVVSKKERHRYFSWKASESLSFWESVQRNKIASVSADELASEDPKQLVAAIQLLDSKNRAIVAANRLRELNGLPRHSDMQILGLFAIIESLVTHQQKDRDLHDSLNHQIATKVPFLLKRSFRPVDASKYFASPQLKSLWKSLYSLRSKIAHGSTLDFRASEFRSLGSSSSVAAYVKDVTKQLIRLQLAEPDLMEDLRAV